MYTNDKIWFGKQMKTISISDVSNGHTKSVSAIQSFENKINSIEWKWKWNCSVLSNSATPGTVSYQVPPSIGFSRQEYWLLLLLSRFSPTLCDPIDGSPPGLPHPWDSPGKSTGLPFPSPDEKHYSPLLMGLFL